MGEFGWTALGVIIGITFMNRRTGNREKGRELLVCLVKERFKNAKKDNLEHFFKGKNGS